MITLPSQLMYEDILDCTERTGTTEDVLYFCECKGMPVSSAINAVNQFIAK